jgi:hypothetical protein
VADREEHGMSLLRGPLVELMEDLAVSPRTLQRQDAV